MTDIAELALRVESLEAVTADRRLQSLERQGRRTETATQKMSRGFGTLKGVLATLGIGLVARKFIQTADAMTGLNARIRLVTKSSAEFRMVQQGIFDIAQRSSAPLQSVGDLYARIGKSLQSTGRDAGASLKIIETVSQTMAISGASAVESSAALTQFSQGLASGVLRGEELNSILEQTPALADAIAEGMGRTRGELRALGAEGKLTADAVLAAIEKQGPKIAKQFETIPDTAGKALIRLENQSKKSIDEVNKALDISKGLAVVITEFTGVIAGLDIAGFLQENSNEVILFVDVAVGAFGVFANGVRTTFIVAKNIIEGFFLTLQEGSGVIVALIHGDLRGAMDAFTLIGNGAKESIDDILNIDPKAASNALDGLRQKIEQGATASDKAADSSKKHESAIKSLGTATDKTAKKFDDQIKVLKDTIKYVKDGVAADIAAARVKLEVAGATEDQIKSLERLQAELDALTQKQRDAADAAQDLADEFDREIEAIEELQKKLRGTGDQIESEFAKAIENAKVGFEDFDGPFRQSIDRMLDAMITFDEASRKSGDAQVQGRLKGFAQMSSALAGMVGEGTAAYQVLTVAANAAAVANAIAGIANQANGDPYTAFARVIAMAGMMASLGIQVGIGGGGGGAAVGALDAVGTNASGIATRGTVLGDTDADSESFLNALDAIETTLDAGLDIDRRQLTALRNIEAALSSVSATFAQFSSTTGVQSLTISGTAGNVQAQAGTGFDLGGANIAGLLDEVTGGYLTAAADSVDVRVNRSIQTLFDNMGAALGSAIETLGGDANAALELFANLDLGTLIIEEGQDIDEAIASLFSSVGDSAFGIISGQLGINLQEFQQIGEGAAETLLRLSTQMQILDDTSGTLGLALDNLSPAQAIAVADALAQQAGGMDALAENVSELFDVLLTDQQRLTRQTEILSSTLADVGLTLPTTSDELRGLVQGLDLTTASGRETFTLLSELAPAFAELFDELSSIRNEALEVQRAFGLAIPEFDQFLLDTFNLARNALPASNAGMRQWIDSLDEADQAALRPFIGDLQALVPVIQDAGAAIASLSQNLRDQADDIRRQISEFGLTQIEVERKRADEQLSSSLAAAALLINPNDPLSIARSIQLQTEAINVRALQEDLFTLRESESPALNGSSGANPLADFAQSFTSRVAGFGLSDVDLALFQLDQTFSGLRATANEVGFDLTLIDRQYAIERQAIVDDFAERALAAEQALRDEQIELARQAAEALAAFSNSFAERVAGFGLSGIDAALFALDREFDGLRNQALELGFDMNQIEAQYGRERLSIIENFNQQALDSERAARASALRDQISALNQVESVARQLRDFIRNNLQTGAGTSAASLASAQQEFFRLANAGRAGDLDAARGVAAAGRSVIDSALNSTGSRVEFDLIRGTVLATASSVADSLDVQVTELDVLQSQLSVLEQIRDRIEPAANDPVIGSGVTVGPGPAGAGIGYNTEPFTLPNGLSRNKYATLLELGIDPADPNALLNAGGLTVAEYAQIPGFANGGGFPGGWRMVGESGPELEFTGASRIYSNTDSQRMLADANRGMEQRLANLERLIGEQNRMAYRTVKNTGKTAKYVERWDGDGIPEERAA